MIPAKVRIRLFQKSPLSPHVDVNLGKLLSKDSKGAIELGLRFKALVMGFRQMFNWKTKI